MRRHSATLISLAAATLMLGCNPLDPFRVIDDKQPIVDVKVSPAETTVVAGSTVQFSVKVFGTGNKVIADRIVTWSVGNPVVAAITSDSGMVTAKAAGKSEILANVENLRAVGILNVTRAP